MIMSTVREDHFIDRVDAGVRLAKALGSLQGRHPLVLGIPRGGVAIGRVIADELDGDLDVVLVRKIGAPGHEEFAIGAVDESGHMQVSDDAAQVGADAEYLRQEGTRQLDRLWQRRRLYSPHRSLRDPRGRLVVVVDDGLATGATMQAALKAVRRRHPARLVAAVPVGSPRSLASIRALADDVVCLRAPADFHSVGQYYRAFPAVEDSEVIALLRGSRDGGNVTGSIERSMEFPVDDVTLDGDLVLPPRARGLVVFVHGSGSSRRSVRNRYVAGVLQQRGFGTLLFDLLSVDEEQAVSERFDIDKLSRRLSAVLRGVHADDALRDLPLGLFGASTGAAAALMVAARQQDVRAVVSRGGRPDLAGAVALPQVKAPVLLIVGGADSQVAALNRATLAVIPHADLILVPGATHLFEEEGALERVATLAADWFARWL